ncbi:MAG: hypothetical protein ABFS41_00875 [Myxococcota bacterium]
MSVRARRVGPGTRSGRCAAALLLALGLASPALAQVVDPGTIVQTIDTSLWSPPAPDPAGITYRPGSGDLLTCDSEVEEMTIFAGVNLWTNKRTVGACTNKVNSTTPKAMDCIVHQ